MHTHEQLIELHGQMRDHKEHQWYVHKEPDLYPILMVRWRGQQAFSIVDIMTIGTILEKIQGRLKRRKAEHWLVETEMSTPLVIFTALSALEDNIPLPNVELPAEGTPMEAIWLATEGYALGGSEEDDVAAEYEAMPGKLQEDYETNPESKVHEQLTTYTVETSSTGLGEWGRVTSGFHKDDGGRIVWHEPMVHTSEDKDLEGSFDKLLDIMVPHVTREALS